MELAELMDSEICDDLSQHELKELYRKFYNKGVDTSYELVDRSEKYWRVYTMLSVFLCMLFFVSNVTGVKAIEISSLNIIVPFAIFVYPLTFLVVDSLNEFFGLSLARKAILLSVIANIIVFIIFLGSQSVLGFHLNQELNNSYNAVISSMSFVFIASIISYFVSENINAYVLNHMKFREESSSLMSRVLTSTSIASVIDSFLFIFIAFWSVFETEILLQMVLSQIGFKFVYAVVGVIPISYTRSQIDKLLENNKKKQSSVLDS